MTYTNGQEITFRLFGKIVTGRYAGSFPTTDELLISWENQLVIVGTSKVIEEKES